MKTLLLVLGITLGLTGVARADHITVAADAEGVQCYFADIGFNDQIFVVHKFSQGATTSRFKVVFPPGSAFFGFISSYSTIGLLTSDMSVGYGTCLTGSWVIGTAVAVLYAGIMEVQPANAFPTIVYSDCNFSEYVATGGRADVATGFCLCCIPTEPTTWGEVKALYR